ncbi:MAG: DegV family protein [Dehalococcoidia bacterium]|nr:MAG: DegV family protein [Dehalococcoidia bacterium]
MAVKVVTDSTCDIPPELAEELGITIVPIYVMFGQETYRDGVDMDTDEFFDRLVHNNVHPTTSVPSPKDFADVYSKLADETDEIISIHLTAKESGTYNSAVLAKDLVEKKCSIEIVDSQSISMSLGMLVIAAARAAKAGKNLEQVTEMVQRNVARMHLMILVDTLKYVIRGGRLNRASGLVGTVLRVRPLLTMKEGDLSPVGVARTKAKAVQRLYNFASSFSKVKELAVAYTTDHDEANSLLDRLKAAFPDATGYLSRVGPSLGTHAGPGAMGVAIWELEGEG